jgi:hypothetical protein
MIHLKSSITIAALSLACQLADSALADSALAAGNAGLLDEIAPTPLTANLTAAGVVDISPTSGPALIQVETPLEEKYLT